MENFEVKRFEFEQKIKLEELELKKKTLELNIQESKNKRLLTPVFVTISGGLLTLIIGLVLNYFEKKSELELEHIKSQSDILISAAETKNYADFVNLVDAFYSSGLIKLDSSIIGDFKKRRKNADFRKHQTKLYYETTSVISYLTVNDNFKSEEYREKLSRFWQLYWVELSAVETQEVESAMVAFGNLLKTLEDNDFQDFKASQNELKIKGYEVAQAIKNSIQ